MGTIVIMRFMGTMAISNLYFLILTFKWVLIVRQATYDSLIHILRLASTQTDAFLRFLQHQATFFDDALSMRLPTAPVCKHGVLWHF